MVEVELRGVLLLFIPLGGVNVFPKIWLLDGSQWDTLWDGIRRLLGTAAVFQSSLGNIGIQQYNVLLSTSMYLFHNGEYFQYTGGILIKPKLSDQLAHYPLSGADPQSYVKTLQKC